jgi:hypothetical protein
MPAIYLALTAHARSAFESARTIAEAAQHFGQEDDITVMTLAVGPALVLHP